MPLLSVALITCNEEGNLRRTLESVRWADQIVVVDSGSTDRTVEIARSFGAEVVERAWPGFAPQKNFAMSLCTGQWILSLDADEELSPELSHQIRTMLSTDPPVDAYRLNRRNLFLGRWIRHGGFYPDAKLRLFRRTVARFAGKHSFGGGPRFENRPVHETVVFNGAEGTLDHDLIHHAYPTLEAYLEHMNRYSTLGAEILLGKGRVSRAWPAFVANVLVLPCLSFCWNYVARMGFLDGREGLLLHLYHAVYTSWKYAKAWELSRAADGRLRAEVHSSADSEVA